MMRFNSIKSLGAKINFIVMFVTFIALFIAILLMLIHDYKAEKSSLISSSHSIARLIGQNATAVVLYRDYKTANEILSSLKQVDNVLKASIYEKSGVEIASYSSGSAKDYVFKDELHFGAKDSGVIMSLDDLTHQWNDYFIIDQPIILEKRAVGSVRLYIGLINFQKQMLYEAFVSFVVFIFSCFISWFITQYFKGKILEPIKTLNTTTSQIIASGDYDLRVVNDSYDEIGLFIKNFNRMLHEIQIRDSNIQHSMTELKLAVDIAERASLAKSEFLSSMSHELKTPLNAIMGFSQILSYGQLSEEQKRHVSKILRAGEHLLELIDDVLELSRIESGKLDLSIYPVSIHKIIAECLSLTIILAKKNNITIENEVFNSSDYQILADYTACKQVIVNLISNAIKYNNKNGTIRLTCQTHKENLRINIIDTGPGIAPEFIPRLFNPFDRLDNNCGTIEGTGIGLTICNHLVTEMNGSIGVDSKVNEGSCFWVELPLV